MPCPSGLNGDTMMLPRIWILADLHGRMVLFLEKPL